MANLPFPMLTTLKINKPNQCPPESLFGIKYTSIIIYIVKFNIWFIAFLLLEFWGWATVAFTTSKLIIISEKPQAMLHVTHWTQQTLTKGSQMDTSESKGFSPLFHFMLPLTSSHSTSLHHTCSTDMTAAEQRNIISHCSSMCAQPGHPFFLISLYTLSQMQVSCQYSHVCLILNGIVLSLEVCKTWSRWLIHIFTLQVALADCQAQSTCNSYTYIRFHV